MESLMRSIDRHGIQVPVVLYEDSPGYRLIDGERRWRCAKLLNLKAVPAIVQEKPTELQNLIMMYNIHALREQWDYFTIASKLTTLIDLFRRENGHEPNEVELSEETGLTRGQIRRCKLIIDLPERFQEMILEELKKPKSQQSLTEDFFIEMERALKTVFTRVPELAERENEIRDVLIQKFNSKTIKAVTDFRMLSKIATSIEGLGIERDRAIRSLKRIFNPANRTGIDTEFREVVEFEYEERTATRSIESILEFLDEVITEESYLNLDQDFVSHLESLARKIRKILEAVDADFTD